MKTILKVKLDSINKVKRFVDNANKFDFDIYIVQGRYTVNGKSIMGVYSLDLTNCLDIVTDTTDEKKLREFLYSIEAFKYEN